MNCSFATRETALRAFSFALLSSLAVAGACGDDSTTAAPDAARASEDTGEESGDASVTDAGASQDDAGGASLDSGTDAGAGLDSGTDGGTDLDSGTDAGDLHPDIVRVIEVPGRNPGSGWSDSYSVGSECYCDSTFDHNIGPIMVETPKGPRTVRQVCDALGPGPGANGRPVYNDIQCGNGPANDAGDEDDCPGRVDIGREGCSQIGPTWNLSRI